MNSKLNNKEDIIRSLISENVPKAEIARLMECNIKTLNNFLSNLDIAYHGNQGGKGIAALNQSKYIPFNIYINRKDININTNKIRKKLLRDGLKQYICEECGNTQWNGLPIPLEVHHKDGNRKNNELTNLQLLCPNCHALTPTYRGKNKKKMNTLE